MELSAKALHAELRFVIEASLLILGQKAFEELLDESSVLAGRQRAQIKAQEKCVRELEIRKLRIEYRVGEHPVTFLFVAAQNNTDILKILGAPIWVVDPSNDLQNGRDDRRRDANSHSSRQMNFDGLCEHVVKSGQAHPELTRGPSDGTAATEFGTGRQEVYDRPARSNPAVLQLRCRCPSDSGQPHCQMFELIEVESNGEIDIARKTSEIAHEDQQRGGADYDQVSSQFLADPGDPRQVSDLIGRKDVVHFRNSRRSSSAASLARGSLAVNNSA
jgi:hypothetical protein